MELPKGHKPPVDLSERDDISLSRLREEMGDGSFGGFYERSETEMLAVWNTAIEETRERLDGAWDE